MIYLALILAVLLALAAFWSSETPAPEDPTKRPSDERDYARGRWFY
jgi:hypothetical protein